MVGVVRRVGIAVGSLVIAWLAVSLVTGMVFGPTASSPFIGVLIVGLGGVIYADILRRERARPEF